jgi:hypothetical protein
VVSCGNHRARCGSDRARRAVKPAANAYDLLARPIATARRSLRQLKNGPHQQQRIEAATVRPLSILGKPSTTAERLTGPPSCPPSFRLDTHARAAPVIT